MIEFDVDWKEAPGVRDPVLARTWCALTIRVHGKPVTRVYDRRTKGWRDSVYGSIFPLCSWLVDNIWFLLFEPYRWATPYGSRDLARNDSDRPWVGRHSLLAAREGGALPDLTIFRDGDNVLVRWLKDGGDTSHPFLRFGQEGHAYLSPDTTRESIAALVESVLERVSDLSHAEVGQLRDDWAELHHLTPEEANLCAWTARLGINAHYDDELSESEAIHLQSAVGPIEGRIVDDLLDAAAIDTIADDLSWINDAHRLAKTASRTSPNRRTADVPRQWSLPSNRETAYATGYAEARALRTGTGLDNKVLANLDNFMQRLGWADTPIVATDATPSSRNLHAVVDYGQGDVPVVAAPPIEARPSQRFLLARSLFFHRSSATSERRLVTASYTWEQRASRAFAAELLAPAEALRQRIRGDSVSAPEVEQYAEEFFVNPVLIERQIENHALARIDRGQPSLRQW